ncbi:unnamed protein product [Pseudo-nitzschia multistriata]|uniref:Uncharacterized protein n=1 Tax=Pseudo-nitzschia multistriata TaxID=183589 RepID=A0A448ZNF9_9STRA|nr:unnamed protein product [Pseudo-nitzschia multistriata]
MLNLRTFPSSESFHSPFDSPDVKSDSEQRHSPFSRKSSCTLADGADGSDRPVDLSRDEMLTRLPYKSLLGSRSGTPDRNRSSVNDLPAIISGTTVSKAAVDCRHLRCTSVSLSSALGSDSMYSSPA